MTQYWEIESFSVCYVLGTCGGYIHEIFAHLGALEYILYVAKIDCLSFSTLNFGEFANSATTYSML